MNIPVDSLDKEQLKKVLDTLFGDLLGDQAKVIELHSYLIFLNQYKKVHYMYLWLIRNQLVGRRLLEFFKEFDSHLDIAIYLLNRLEGRVYTKEWYKADELKGVKG